MSFWSRWLPLLGFKGSRRYWEQRYRLGGNAGSGSFGDAARYKADILNAFVVRHDVTSVIEFGCGDGHQLALAEYPSYTGLDISERALEHCRQRFAADPSKRFKLVGEGVQETADLSMSIDVIFHLVEDDVFETYMDQLFAAAQRFVVIYSTSTQARISTLPHVRHRDVESYTAARFAQFERICDEENSLPAPVAIGEGEPTRFLFYRRVTT